MQTKLHIAVEDRAPKVESSPQREKFVLINKQDKTEKFSHYAVRGQSGYCDRTVSRLRHARFPRMTVRLELECQPNPRNLFIRLKESNDPEFKICGNNISTFNEEALIGVLNQLNDQKREV